MGIHPDEQLIAEWQSDRARSIGERKNLFDLRRVAVMRKLHSLMRQPAPAVLAA